MYTIGQKLYCSELQRVGRLINYDNDKKYAYMLFIVNGEEEILNVNSKTLISPLEIENFIKKKRKHY